MFIFKRKTAATQGDLATSIHISFIINSVLYQLQNCDL